ncbi:hypothetical protein D9619_013397 [Psilocybe cf. subviscida]|uniref:Uncharacterized protein n=1 Tax=Psilocybe cf. subviscida TaxID=2480587 RepID=A0A8H5BRG9_9AGAR|nr:hypothetical protein D9619_013397 [Psilocybe cf. subviscida]
MTVHERDVLRIRRPGDSMLIYFSPTFESSRPTSLPLLLVNRQLYGELTACLQRLATSIALRYEGIVELINERSIHPTWTLIPIMAKHIPVVFVQILISNSPGEQRGRSAWMAASDGPGPMVWGLLSLLQAFVEGGPLLGWNKAPQGWKGTVDTLVLEVKTPEPVDGLVIKTPEQWRLQAAVYPAGHVVDEISGFMSMILSGENYTIGYGKRVASCVKKIQLLLDGAEIEMWDVEAKSHLRAPEISKDEWRVSPGMVYESSQN